MAWVYIHVTQAQARDWMQPLKDACGPKLLSKKFVRKKSDQGKVRLCEAWRYKKRNGKLYIGKFAWHHFANVL